MFKQLYSTILREWPAVLELPVRGNRDGVFIVEGLIDLENKISRIWVGLPDEVLMVNLNWAITGAYKDAFRVLDVVRHEDLDAAAARNHFEKDLKRIQAGKVPTWTDDDRLIIERYFAGTSGH